MLIGQQELRGRPKICVTAPHVGRLTRTNAHSNSVVPVNPGSESEAGAGTRLLMTRKPQGLWGQYLSQGHPPGSLRLRLGDELLFNHGQHYPLKAEFAVETNGREIALSNC